MDLAGRTKLGEILSIQAARWPRGSAGRSRRSGGAGPQRDARLLQRARRDGTGLSFCRERLARFKLPRRVQVVTSLPVTSVGKVDKVQLRSLATGDASPSEPSR